MATGNTAIWEYLFCKTLLHLSSRDFWTLTWQEGPLSPGPQWKEYKEHASARFHCSRCMYSWNSVHVTLFFYMVLGKRRQRGGKVGTVSGCILRQDCKYCGVGVPGTPDFEDDDIAIILHNLLIHIRRQCYGEYVDDNLLQVPIHGSPQGLHQSDLCEACRLGVCKWTSPKWRPEGNAGRQPRWHESKEHVEIPMEPQTITSEEKPESECCMWRCCGCFTVLIALFLLLVILYFGSKFVLQRILQ